MALDLGQVTEHKTPTVGERLADLGKIFDERSALYGKNYHHFGKVMIGMFPEGLMLETEEEFSRFAIFVLSIVKQTRYAMMFKRGGHPDSLDDNAVYTMMLREVDEVISNNKEAEEMAAATKAAEQENK